TRSRRPPPRLSFSGFGPAEQAAKRRLSLAGQTGLRCARRQPLQETPGLGGPDKLQSFHRPHLAELVPSRKRPVQLRQEAPGPAAHFRAALAIHDLPQGGLGQFFQPLELPAGPLSLLQMVTVETSDQAVDATAVNLGYWVEATPNERHRLFGICQQR